MSIGLRQLLSKHCVCLWSEKTTVCRIFSCQRSGLPDSAGNLFTSARLARRLRSAATTATDVGVRETQQPHSPTETFQITRGPVMTLIIRCRSQPTKTFAASLLPANRQPAFQRAKGGGEYRSRTGDLLVANQALSQLS